MTERESGSTQSGYTAKTYSLEELLQENKQLKEDKSLLDRMLTEVSTDAINMEQKLYNLKDRYLNQNKKHFDELCGEYFDD